MKKKLALLLSILSVMMMLGACGTDPTTVDYNGVTYDQLYSQSVSLGTVLAGATEAELAYEIQYLEYLEAYPSNNTSNIDTAFYIDLTEKWMAAMEESGSYVGMVEDGFTVDKAGKTLTTTLLLEFEKRDVSFQLVYNYHNMELTGVTIDPVYSLGEKMATAGMNTVICMGVVFLVLIGISLLISGFKIFSYLEAKKKEQEEALKASEVNDNFVTQIEQREEQQLTDDTELVAVIAAAIAEYEGTSTSDFVVRSITRR